MIASSARAFEHDNKPLICLCPEESPWRTRYPLVESTESRGRDSYHQPLPSDAAAWRFPTGVSKQDAQVALKGTTSGDKNELLFSRFDTNYNDIPQRFRKGTTLFRGRPTAAGTPSPEASQLPPGRDTAATDKGDQKAGGRSAVAENVVGRGAGAGGKKSSGPQASEARNQEAPAVIEVERSPAVASSADGNPESALEAEEAHGGEVSVGAAGVAGKDQAGAAVIERCGKGEVDTKAKTGSRDDAIVRVVSCGAGKGRSKRLLKKGHAPPGAIEEEACDLIRDDFWDRNAHILAGGVSRR